jgi:class 3 adenylate cyclase
MRCAVEGWQGMAKHNAQVSRARRIEFRIGISLGDIIMIMGGHDGKRCPPHPDHVR